jgi:hypothetical protein
MSDPLGHARWILCASSLAACGANGGNNAVSTYVNPDGAFASYRTFAVAPPPDVDGGTSSDSVTSLQQADGAASAQLTQRGLARVEADQDPDVIWFSLATTDAAAARVFPCLPGRFDGNWPFDFPPCAGFEGLYTRFEPQSLLVGLVDPHVSQIVFGGLIPNVPEASTAPGGRVAQGIAGVFSAYPRRSASVDAAAP